MELDFGGIVGRGRERERGLKGIYPQVAFSNASNSRPYCAASFFQAFCTSSCSRGSGSALLYQANALFRK